MATTNAMYANATYRACCFAHKQQRQLLVLDCFFDFFFDLETASGQEGVVFIKKKF